MRAFATLDGVRKNSSSSFRGNERDTAVLSVALAMVPAAMFDWAAGLISVPATVAAGADTLFKHASDNTAIETSSLSF